jgi:hypothetical protein
MTQNYYLINLSHHSFCSLLVLVRRKNTSTKSSVRNTHKGSLVVPPLPPARTITVVFGISARHHGEHQQMPCLRYVRRCTRAIVH